MTCDYCQGDVLGLNRQALVLKAEMSLLLIATDEGTNGDSLPPRDYLVKSICYKGKL